MTIDTFNFEIVRAHTLSNEWKTIIDNSFSGNQQRRQQWSKPRKTFKLDFQNNPTNTNAIIAFHDAQKGSTKSFYWTYPTNKGGDGIQRLFTMPDKLDLTMFMGYSEFSITFTEVFN